MLGPIKNVTSIKFMLSTQGHSYLKRDKNMRLMDLKARIDIPNDEKVLLLLFSFTCNHDSRLDNIVNK